MKITYFKRNIKSRHLWNEIDKKKKIYWISIIFVSVLTLVLGLVGSLTGEWGVEGNRWILYLTNWTTIIIFLFYGTLVLFSLLKQEKRMEQLLNPIVYGAIASWIAFTLFFGVIVIWPMELFELGDIGPGAITEETMVTKNVDLAGLIITNIFVFFILPLMVIYDFWKNKFVNFISGKTVIYWSAYLLLYLGFTFLNGGQIEWYPYTISDPDVFDAWVLLWSFALIIVYYVYSFYVVLKITNKEHIIKSND